MAPDSARLPSDREPRANAAADPGVAPRMPEFSRFTWNGNGLAKCGVQVGPKSQWRCYVLGKELFSPTWWESWVKLDDVEPAVLRRVQVPVTIRLDRLHLVLQAAMGWTNSHLYEIRAHDVGWGMSDPDFGDGPLDASKARLIDVLEDVGTRSLKYVYDFGDCWEHSVRIERITDAVPGMIYPCPSQACTGGSTGTPRAPLRQPLEGTSRRAGPPCGLPAQAILRGVPFARR